ncbi:MAG: L,D-transpeptidase [Bacteroidota bacterium]
MRLALIVAVILISSISFADEPVTPIAEPAEQLATDEQDAPSLAEPLPLPDYIPAPTAEPLRPLRKTAGPKVVPPPMAQVTPVPVPVPVPTPRPPVTPEVPKPHFEPSAAAALTIVYPAPGTSLVEGDNTIVWNTGGRIAYVRLSYAGQKCTIGGQPRGTFSGTITKTVNKGQFQWQVPWMDTPELKLHIAGYGVDDKQLAYNEATYQLKPKIAQRKPDTCIVVSKARQRLWYLKDGVIKRMHVISTAAAGFYTPNMRPGSRDRTRGAMGRIFSKSVAPVSREYEVVMPHWLQITSSGSHGIHATSPPFYSRLGHPASHGCIRQHRADAKILYDMVRVGTPVYVE